MRSSSLNPMPCVIHGTSEQSLEQRSAASVERGEISDFVPLAVHAKDLPPSWSDLVDRIAHASQVEGHFPSVGHDSPPPERCFLREALDPLDLRRKVPADEKGFHHSLAFLVQERRVSHNPDLCAVFSDKRDVLVRNREGEAAKDLDVLESSFSVNLATCPDGFG